MSHLRTMNAGRPAATDLDTPDRHLARLAERINVLDVLRHQAGISRESIDIGAALEYSAEIGRRAGRPANGMYLPHVALSGARGLTVGTPTAGGHTVATNLLANEFVDMLRPRAKVVGAGATVLQGLTGNIAIPRQTSGAAAYWISEGNEPTESQAAFDQVQMQPRTVGAWTQISRKMLLQSSVGVQDLVTSDLMATIATAVDAACVAGLGGTQPTGILQAAGVQSQTIAGAKPTWQEMVDMHTKCAGDSNEEAVTAYLVTSKVKGDLASRERTAGNGVYLWSPRREGENEDGNIGGVRALVTNNLPQNLGAGTNQHALICGVWSDLIVGMWGNVDILLDPYSKSTSGALRVTAFQDLDVCLRHPERFVKAQYNPT